ncbi:MAG: 16S rRNA (cytosine(967)-C(5))-methyltransferase RsmB [Lachnospiraceae bacterium]|nr:16S rRNA (cytosine(967)-C(5))-methyltransferase RsmB [Lachnospiraceae bacterium]
MAENTREIVLDMLLTIERGEEYSHKLIKAVLDKYDYLDVREKAFMKRLTEGTIEKKIQLDYVIDQFSSVPVRKMKPLIRCLMRMSAYQILYMDSVPDSAVCNEAVKLSVKRKFQNLKGFVNGVLRNLARGKGQIKWPDKEGNLTEWLTITYSMPKFLVELWIKEYGVECTQKMLSGLEKVHPVSIRFQTRLDKTTILGYIAQMEALGVKVTPSPYLEYAYLLERVEGIASLPGYAEGAFTVQDVSSMLAVEAAGIKSTDFVLDICAAPGGKSLLAAEKAKEVLSRDVSFDKLSLIEENADRMQANNLTVMQWDATVTDEDLFSKADVVLMDVPCSGLGVIGKKRDIKYHVTPESLGEITKLQKAIVSASWQYVKPEGILLYSTCTVRREENEEMCRWICENFPFTMEESRQLFPGEDDCDGFFYARLRRNKGCDVRKA